MKRKTNKRLGVLTAGVALLVCTTSYAQTWAWTNADDDNNYMNGNNWITNGVVAGNPPDAGVAQINSNGVEKCIFSDGAPVNINSVDVGFGEGAYGELEVNGGVLKATANSSKYSIIANGAGCTGLVTVAGGTWEVNRFRVGRNGGVGTLVVKDGTFKVARGNGGYSIWMPASTGATEGYVEISGGVVTTRTGVQLNDNGILTVKGGGSIINIGGAGGADQCKFDVNPGGTLAVQVATNGLSAIEVDNEHATLASYITFDPGSFLEPSFLDGHIETNAWVVMTLENSDAVGTGITADDLTLAAGVDPNWAFGVTNNPVDETEVLWVGYAGAVYNPPELPPTSTNLLVDAVVAMPDTWNLYAPLPGNSLTSQSSSGFTATIAANTYTNDRSGFIPVVAQEFTSDRDLSEVGQTVVVNFDIEMLDDPSTHDKDFHFGFYDTDLNVQLWAGFDMGFPSGSQFILRYNNQISALSTNEFLPGDYGWFGTAGGSFGAGANYSGAGLVKNHVMHFESSFTRTGTNEVTYTTLVWDYSGSGSTGYQAQVINELAPPNSELPSGFKWESLNGFGFNLFENSPFVLDTGSYVVSNFEVTSTTLLPEGWGYSVSEIAVDSSGDIMLTLSEPIVGATYDVVGRTALTHGVPSAVGTYVAEEPGVIFIPAADAGLNTFFHVELPVIEVIE